MTEDFNSSRDQSLTAGAVKTNPMDVAEEARPNADHFRKIAVKYAGHLREISTDALLEKAHECADPDLEHTGERPDLYEAECEVSAGMLAAVLDDWGFLGAELSAALTRAREAEANAGEWHRTVETVMTVAALTWDTSAAGAAHVMRDHLDELRTQISTLTEERDAARQALKPFSRLSIGYADHLTDDEPFVIRREERGKGRHFTLGDIRRAASIAKGEG